MSPRYYQGKSPSYNRLSRADHTSTPLCRQVAAPTVDDAVAALPLKAVTPAQLALALAAADEVAERHTRSHRAAELADPPWPHAYRQPAIGVVSGSRGAGCRDDGGTPVGGSSPETSPGGATMAGWSGVAGEHDFVVADQARAQRLAEALAVYGFALVAAGTRSQGRWGVQAYDYGPYPPDRAGFRSFDAVGRHAAALARQHGGYWSGGSQCDPSMMPSNPPDAPIVLANPGSRPPVPAQVITPAPPAARLALTPDRVADADTDATAVDLTRLDDVPWAQLDHAHGAATDIPKLIRALARQPGDWAAIVDELLGDDLLHQGTCYSATAPALPFLARLLVSGSLAAPRRLHLCTGLVFAADRWPASLLVDADRAAAHHRPPAAAPWTQDVHRAVAQELPALLARWGDEPPALRYVLACLAGLYPDQGRAVADEVAAMAADHTGTQHGTYLRLAAALVHADDGHALEIARDILTWEDDLDPDSLDVPGVTATVRAGHVLAEGVLLTADGTD